VLSELGEYEVERALGPEEAKGELLRERALRRRPRVLAVCEVVATVRRRYRVPAVTLI
jgi:hypothetical protein